MSRRGLLSNGPGSSRTGSARPATSASSSRGGGGRQQDKIQMPEYEPPSFALDTSARHALAELSRNTTDARRYGGELEKSVRLLGECVGEVNDRLHDRREALAARLERKRKDHSGEDEDEETRALRAAIDTLGQEAPGLTRRCDEGVRQVIDWMVEMEDARTAAANTVQEVEQESIGVETRAQAAQARANWRAQERERRIDSGQLRDDDDDDEEEEEQDDEAGERLKGPLKRLRENKDRLRADYEGKTPYQRYGLNNDYIQFKKQWHEAAHRDGKPLPDASKWFSSRNNDGGEDEEDDEEDDDDLIVARETKDMRCPLSMVLMQEPFTSSKCNHTFEKTAIMEFLRSQPGRSSRCPQTGCSKEVSIRDFSLDHSMLRQIKRAQRQDVDDDDDDDDEEGEAADLSMRVTSHRKIKKEPRDRGRGNDVEDGGGEEEEEEEEGDEEEEEEEEADDE